jgi:glutamate/tyrosine decarboxylase-like PLP-dependent enzyme
MDTQRESTLDLSKDIWLEFAEHAQVFVKDYLERVSELPIFPQGPTERFVESLANNLPEQGSSVDEIMEQCRAILEASRHSGHPRFFGYVASSASPVGMIGDQLASALNQNLTAWRSSPAATDLERTVVRWLGSFVGFSDDAGGLLTSGGSMANLNALYIAHRTKLPSASSKGLWHAGKTMTVYASEQIHLSIPKAADVLGIGRDHVRLIKTDERLRLDTKDLREQIEHDIQNGFQPFALVASAGTVNTGAVDPLSEMAAIAREYDLWFHIDGAYGAPGAAVHRKRELFSGLELADSVSLDPHKWLYAPIDCGCLLLHDPQRARSAFSHGDADYIKIYEESDLEAFAFWDYGIELTRRFRALKVWMILQYYGASRIRDTISEDIDLAEYLAERIVTSEDFELLAPVELSICCFRYLPSNYRDAVKAATRDDREKLNVELDTINETLMNRVQRGGRAYLSSAVLNGRFALRVCIVNFRTTRADLDMTLEILRSEADAVEK